MKKILVLSLLAVSAASNAVVVWGSGGNLPDFANGAPGTFTSTITLAAPGSLKGVIFENFRHTWVGDLIVNVSGIGVVMSRLGSTTATGTGDSSNLLGDYTFMNGQGDLWAEANNGASTYNLAPGSYRPTGALSPAEVPFNVNLNAGVYTLTITDNAGLDVGSLGRWGIDYNPVPEPATMAVLGLGALAAIRRRRAR